MALVSETWTRLCLEQTAELAEGDTRVAIQTLNNAARFAEDSNSRAIDEEHIKKGWNNASELLPNVADV